jgi:hypothetical protein
MRRRSGIPGTGAVVACAALLAVGCADASQPAAAPPAQPSHAAPAASAISPAQRKAAARGYLAIALPANYRLDADFDGFDDNAHDNLTAAQADLRDAAATERQFDRRLLGLTLPPATEEIARLLVTANQARARLAEMAAASTSLSQIRGYEHRLTAANAPVEEAVHVIRSQLGLPPPETS